MSFRAHRLPGDVAPATPAPDLTALGWSPVAGGVGHLAGRDVTAYAYRDREGRRLLVYTSGQAFTTPAQAREYGGDGAWVTRLGAVSVLCGRTPHRTMVVGLDEKQVAAAAQYLKLT